MSRKATQVSATVLVLATAFGVLLYSSLGESLQHVQGRGRGHGCAAAVGGEAAEGARLRGAQLDRAEGKHGSGPGSIWSATARRCEPSTRARRRIKFKDQAEVVLTGVLKDNEFHATEMTAKCPSKYEERAPSEVGL